MDSTYKYPFILLVVATVLLSFQNCAIYESDGRLALEQIIQKNPSTNCLPYMDSNIAINIMNAASAGILVRFNPSPPAGSFGECDISLLNGSTQAIDNAACGIANDYSSTAGLQLAANGAILSQPLSQQVAMLNQDPNSFIEVDADPSPDKSLSGGSFGYAYKVNNSVILRFVGAKSGNSKGIACYFVYSSLGEFQDPTIGKVTGLKRLSDLTHVMVGNL